MGLHFDNSETRTVADREAALFAALPDFLGEATAAAPGLAQWLDGIDLHRMNSRAALAKLPVLRKPELMQFQADNPPFGGFVDQRALKHGRVSPVARPGMGAAGPRSSDPWWGCVCALYAAGIRPGDIVHNCFSYHMTPGGFLVDAGARTLGCLCFPPAPATRTCRSMQPPLSSPRSTAGTPDFLKVILDRATELEKDV